MQRKRTMKREIGIVSCALVLCLCLSMAVFAVFVQPAVADAFSADIAEECDRLFAMAMGETVDAEGNVGDLIVDRSIVYDIELQELGYIYAYRGNDASGYAVVLVQNTLKVTEIVPDATDPYAEFDGERVYVSEFKYAVHSNGCFTLTNGVEVNKSTLENEPHYLGIGTGMTTTQKQIYYTSKSENKYQVCTVPPDYYAVDLTGACVAAAGGNIIMYYDRFVESLIPDYTPGRQLGTLYQYKGANDTTNSVISTLYTDMQGTSAGISVANFKSGLQAYCTRNGATATFTSCMSNGTLNYAGLKTKVSANIPVIIFVERLTLSDIGELSGYDDYVIMSGYAMHALVAFGYNEITYTLSDGTTSLNKLVLTASGYAEMPKAYLNIDNTLIADDAYSVSIVAR